MDGRTELLGYLGTSIVTIVALFGLQEWYASYLDVSVVHAQIDSATEQKISDLRVAETQKLSSGPMPIEQAKRLLAQRGRTAFPKIAPKASDDLSAMSGWIQQPGFHAYEARTPPPPPVEQQVAEGTEGTAAAAVAAPAAAQANPGEARP